MRCVLIKMQRYGQMFPPFVIFLRPDESSDATFLAQGLQFCRKTSYFSSIADAYRGSSGGGVAESNFSTNSRANKAESDEATRGTGWRDEPSLLYSCPGDTGEKKKKVSNCSISL